MLQINSTMHTSQKQQEAKIDDVVEVMLKESKEKIKAVILQQVVGTQYGDRFYPSISGVARSLNYYPIGDEKPKREL